LVKISFKKDIGSLNLQYFMQPCRIWYDCIIWDTPVEWWFSKVFLRIVG